MTQGEIYIKNHIKKHGSISVRDYMDQCLNNPDWGYYQTKNPLGRKGDFITSPELGSQMAQSIALWLQDQWNDLGKPKEFILCELGAGQGTLIKDILGYIADNNLIDISDIHIIMIETSPKLRDIQKNKLIDYVNITWYKELKQLPPLPALFVANELFDAIPIDQYINIENCFYRREIKVDQEDKFQFHIGWNKLNNEFLPLNARFTAEGSIFEYSQQRKDIFAQMITHVASHGGGGLVIDYGSLTHAYGDTLQAMKDHKIVDIFNEIGNCDLTSHVNFEQFIEICKKESINYMALTQGNFLNALGLAQRVEKQLQYLDKQSKYSLVKEYNYLTDPSYMGELFKVLCFGAGCS